MRTFDDPDETRRPDKTQMDIVDLGTAKVARLTAQPGWTWSECIKPIADCEMRFVSCVSVPYTRVGPRRSRKSRSTRRSFSVMRALDNVRS